MKTILLQNTGTTVFTVIAFITIFFGSITTSFAEGVEGKGYSGHKGKMFEKTDTNGDGVISHEEFSAKAEERFKMMDSDGNGKVTREEVKNHHAGMREKHNKHHGANKAAGQKCNSLSGNEKKTCMKKNYTREVYADPDMKAGEQDIDVRMQDPDM